MYFSSNSSASVTRWRYGGRAASEDGRSETRNSCSKAVVTGLQSVLLKFATCEEGRAVNRCASRKSRTEVRFFKRVDKSSEADGEGRKESVSDKIPEESFEAEGEREVGCVRRWWM
jgi:hypothetical protein